MKPRIKQIRKTVKVATVYFPVEWGMEDRNRQRWLRARGFSSRQEDLSYSIRYKTPESDARMWTPAAHCRIAEVKKVEERFMGASLLHTIGVWAKADDVTSLYELLLERFEPFRNGPVPELQLKNTRRGRAVTSAWCPRFSVPLWVFKRCEEWVIYYMAHELAHHAFGGICHGPRMCEVEAALLAPFDIKIVYKGVRTHGKNEPWYPHQLVRISDGSVICGEVGKRV